MVRSFAVVITPETWRKPSKTLPSTENNTPTDLPTVIVNGQKVAFSGKTVADLLITLEIKTRALAVELNQHIVPANEHATTSIADGDQLEIVTLVGGG